MTKSEQGYSALQIGLHWAVVVLVAFQYVAHNAIEAAWNAFQRNEPPAGSDALVALHIGAGVAILVLMLARIGLRMTRGAPSPPADEPRLLQVFAEGVHYAIYGLLLLLPLTGLVAWFLGVPAAASVHVVLKTALLVAVALHVAGALFQHFVRRSDVLMRMLRPRPDAPLEVPAGEAKRT
ncbi:MAG: cytochrome b [Rhizobiaceae bacterium]